MLLSWRFDLCWRFDHCWRFDLCWRFDRPVYYTTLHYTTERARASAKVVNELGSSCWVEDLTGQSTTLLKERERGLAGSAWARVVNVMSVLSSVLLIVSEFVLLRELVLLQVCVLILFRGYTPASYPCLLFSSSFCISFILCHLPSLCVRAVLVILFVHPPLGLCNAMHACMHACMHANASRCKYGMVKWMNGDL